MSVLVAPSAVAQEANVADPQREEEKTDAGATQLDTIQVTGTRIRGGVTPSPVITIGSEAIRAEGFSDLGEVVRALPQNYAGGQNPGVLSAGSGSSNITNQNGTGGSGLNLRGVGPDATLTLLNGRRMSYSSFAQAVDISAIPLDAIDRVEIVADGASAIYGSDAVAGVGNVVLKRDFDGVAVGARYGSATDGGLATREYTATGGGAWASGGFVAAFKHAASDPVYADQRAYTDAMHDPYTLYPRMDLRSALVSGHQALGDNVELRVDALRTEREQLVYQGYGAFYYDSRGDTTTSLLSPSVMVALPRDWTLVAGGSWGEDENIRQTFRVTGQAGTPNLLVESCYCNESRVYEVSADGPIFRLGADDARLAIGAGYRTNTFTNRSFLSESRYGGSESSRFAYGEISLPLIGAGANASGARRLEFNAALRTEDYDSFGRITTPKLGLVYGPGPDFTLKGSWGRSFKAPTLDQKFQPRYVFLERASAVGGTGYPDDATVLFPWGGSDTDLDPERAGTWTASLAFHPEALPGLEAELTWFNIDYTDRVVQPLTGRTQSLSNPAFAEFINDSPGAEELAEILARYAYAFYNNAGAEYDPDNVVAIGYGQYANARRQWIEGADLSGVYRFDTDGGRWTLRGSASWLQTRQQLTAGQDAYDLAGTIHYPAKFRARLGAVWSSGGLTASMFANYTDGVVLYAETDAQEKTGSFPTFDATLRYRFGDGWALSGTEIALYAQNLLDRAPPLYTPAVPTNVPFDSANYSAIGRLVGVSASRHW